MASNEQKALKHVKTAERRYRVFLYLLAIGFVVFLGWLFKMTAEDIRRDIKSGIDNETITITRAIEHHRSEMKRFNCSLAVSAEAIPEEEYEDCINGKFQFAEPDFNPSDSELETPPTSQPERQEPTQTSESPEPQESNPPSVNGTPEPPSTIEQIRNVIESLVRSIQASMRSFR